LKSISFSILLVLFLGPASQAAELFQVKEDSARTGSRIRPVSASANVPFELDYDQLSDGQVQIVRAGYESLPQSYEPPYPEGGIEAIYKFIDQALNSATRQVQGEMLIGAQVDEKGLVQNVSFYLTPTQDMATLAAHALMRVKFKPATCKGDPCAMEFPLYMDFQPRTGEPEPGHQGIWLQFVSADDRADVVGRRR